MTSTRSVTMREIAQTVNKPESTVYRWRHENHELFTAAKEYAERAKKKQSGGKEGSEDV